MADDRAPATHDAEDLEELAAELYGKQREPGAPTDPEEMRILFDMSRDLLSIAGFDGHFQLLNPAWVVTLGYDRAELCARPFIDFVHPDDRAATVTVAARLQGGGRLVGFQNRYRAKDGSYRSLAWRATVSVEKQRYYAIARDVTERREWQETASVLSAIMDSSDDAIIVHGEGGVITSWSSGAERLYGYSATEAIGQPSAILIPPESAREIAGLLDLIKHGEAPDRVDTVMLGKGGREVRVSLAMLPYGDGSGHITGAVTVARDRRGP